MRRSSGAPLRQFQELIGCDPGVAGSKLQVQRRCGDGRAGDGLSWWYRSGQVEELDARHISGQ